MARGGVETAVVVEMATAAVATAEAKAKAKAAKSKSKSGQAKVRPSPAINLASKPVTKRSSQASKFKGVEKSLQAMWGPNGSVDTHELHEEVDQRSMPPPAGGGSGSSTGCQISARSATVTEPVRRRGGTPSAPSVRAGSVLDDAESADDLDAASPLAEPKKLEFDTSSRQVPPADALRATLDRLNEQDAKQERARRAQPLRSAGPQSEARSAVAARSAPSAQPPRAPLRLLAQAPSDRQPTEPLISAPCAKGGRDGKEPHGRVLGSTEWRLPASNRGKKRGADHLNNDDQIVDEVPPLGLELEARLARVQAQELRAVEKANVSLAHCLSMHLETQRACSVSLVADTNATLDAQSARVYTVLNDAHALIPTQRKEAVATYRKLAARVEEVGQVVQRQEAQRPALLSSLEEEERRLTAKRQEITKAFQAEQRQLLADFEAELQRIDKQLTIRLNKSKRRRAQPPPELQQLLTMLNASLNAIDSD